MLYDLILVGSGPGAAAYCRSMLRRNPGIRVLMLEAGPYNKTDILTDPNPFKVWAASGGGERGMVKEYEHNVMQGHCVGGGTAVNNYAWVTPSLSDVKSGFGFFAEEEQEIPKAFGKEDKIASAISEFEAFANTIISKAPPHLMHKQLTSKIPDHVSITTNYKASVNSSNRSTVNLGCPTLDSRGNRWSAFTGAIEPLWRQYFCELDICPNSPVSTVIFDDKKNATN